MVSDDDDDGSELEADPLYARVCAAGESLCRLDRSEEPNEDGLCSVWHQGKDLSELTSWEDDKGIIHRQELIFAGFALEYRRGHELRTGSVDEDRPESDLPTADSIAFHSFPSLRVLELAARLLREARRDYYTQHLLQQLNDALTSRFNRPQTQVYGLAKWQERLRRASDGLRRSNRVHIAVYVLIGALIGAIVTLVLLTLMA